MRRNILKIWLFATGLILSILLEFFAIRNYHLAIPMADENLRGLALSLSSTIESIAMKDKTLKLLESLQSPDIAFFSVMDKEGLQVFHSNSDLIGLKAEDFNAASDLFSNGYSEARIILGTGEEAYEFIYPIHIPDSPLLLRLVMHAYRADTIVRRAKIGVIVIFSMLGIGWIFGLLLYTMSVKAESQRKAIDEKQNLARLGTMGAVLAHEVRNPLAGIKGYAQLLSEKLKDTDIKAFSELIVKEAIRLESLVNDLLEYARSEKTEIFDFHLKEAMIHAISLIENEASQKNIIIDKTVGDNILVSGNRDKFIQVILNIARNAIQAMPEGGSLFFKTVKLKTEAEIRIRDTGPGIDKDDQDKIFEPFYTTKARGSGFGLAISKKHMEEMNGKINVNNKPGEGCTFRLVLSSPKKEKTAS